MEKRENTTLQPPVFLAAAIVLMVACHFLAPGTRLLPFAWNLLGLLLLAAGIYLNLVADAAFKHAGTTVKSHQRSSALITSGVFRVSRHPMYLGMALLLLGLAMLLGTATPFVWVPVFILIVELRYIPVEERMLADTFGPDWDRYKKRTRRWL